jgi:hypothetical protein
VHIGLDRESRSGEDRARRADEAAIEAKRMGEAQPFGDAALALALAVVVEDALAPGAAERRVLRAGEDRRVLQADARLVIVA